jgi:hypothetical protein
MSFISQTFFLSMVISLHRQEKQVTGPKKREQLWHSALYLQRVTEMPTYSSVIIVVYLSSYRAMIAQSV